MAQYKKLLEGEKIPKTYGHLWVDGIDYGNSEEVYNAFANHARSQGLNQGEFYDQWLTALRNGQDVIFGNGNTVNMKPEDMSAKRAGKRSGWTKFWDDTFDTRRNHFSDAIATARGFTFTPKPAEPAKPKAEFDTSEIILNYNDDPKKKGHRIWSTGHADNQRAIQRVTDALAGLKDPDNAEYTFNDSLKAAYQIAANSGMTPEEYAQAVWGRLQDNAWVGYKDPENNNDLDWLKAFGIGVAPYEAPVGVAPSVASTPATTTVPESDETPKEETSSTDSEDPSAQKIAELEAQIAALQAQQPVKYNPISGTKVIYTDPDNDGWSTYTFSVDTGNNYQYNTNRNTATGRSGDQAPAERKQESRLSITAKQIGETPLVYNGVNYPIIQEKDTNTYYALTNNGRIKVEQDFVNRWLEGKLSEQDNAKMSKWAGQKPKTTDENGNELGWLVQMWNRLNGPAAQVDMSKQTRKDRAAASRPKETREEFKARRQREAYERSLAAGGSKDPSKNRFAPKQLNGGIIKAQDGDKLGDPNYNSAPAWQSLTNAGLGALDYGSMAWGRKKVHDQIEKGLWDSLYKRTTPRLQGITTATPIEDADVARYDQYVQRGLTTPLTSDNVTNTQNVLTLQANALQGREQAVRQQSAAALQRQMQNQQIANQQAQLDAESENDFRARLSGLRMNLAQNDASLTAQTAQSIQNLAREWRTRYDEQTGKYNQLAYNQEVADITQRGENTWNTTLATKYGNLWTEWQNESDKGKYGNDFNTWASETGKWTDALNNDYMAHQRNLRQQTLAAYKNYNLSPELAWMYRDRYGVPSRKSGGSLTVKQRNRYKNEPSEDIWINQNKATHKLVAKLNDNIIKTFLKTLK